MLLPIILETFVTILILFILIIIWCPTFLVLVSFFPILFTKWSFLTLFQLSTHIILATLVTLNLLRCKYFGEYDRLDYPHPIDFISKLHSFQQTRRFKQDNDDNNDEKQQHEQEEQQAVYVDPLLPDFLALQSDPIEKSITITNNTEQISESNINNDINNINDMKSITPHLPFQLEGEFADDPYSPFNLAITNGQVKSIIKTFTQLFSNKKTTSQQIQQSKLRFKYTLQQLQLINPNSQLIHKQRLYRLCTHCDHIKSPRMHHCSHCNKCHLQYDHYCIFLNQCITYNNKRSFYLFLLYTTLGMIWSIFILPTYFRNTIIRYFIDFTTATTSTSIAVTSFSIPLLIYSELLLPSIQFYQIVGIPFIIFFIFIINLWLFHNTTMIEWLFQSKYQNGNNNSSKKKKNKSSKSTTSTSPTTSTTSFDKSDQIEVQIEQPIESQPSQINPFFITYAYSYGFILNWYYFFGSWVYYEPIALFIHLCIKSKLFHTDDDIERLNKMKNADLEAEKTLLNHAENVQSTIIEKSPLIKDLIQMPDPLTPELILIIEQDYQGHFSPLNPKIWVLLQLYRYMTLQSSDFEE